MISERRPIGEGLAKPSEYLQREASIRARRTGCKLRRVMMSVLRPRIRAAASFTSINAKSPRTLGMIKEQIDIGIFACLAPRGRAEQVEMLNAESLQLGFVLLELGNNFAAFHRSPLILT